MFFVATGKAQEGFYLLNAEENMESNNIDKLSDSDFVLAENSQYMLVFNDTNYQIRVKDKNTGFWWSTSPSDAQDDELAEGITKTNMLSHIVVNYSPAGTETRVTNSLAGSVSYGNAKWQKIKDGIRIIYNFERERFSVPLEFVLEKDGLRVSILFDQIEEDINKILSIDLLPFFGAARQGQDGYLFIPDGSGAVVSFENLKEGISAAYRKKVYGEDPSIPVLEQTSREQKIKMPVFGIKNKSSGFLGVILEGSANASIAAGAAGQTSSYFHVFSSAEYRPSGKIQLQAQMNAIKEVLLLAKTPVTNPRYTVKYFFLHGDMASYVGMADTYRQLLIQQGLNSKTDGNPRLFIDFYGGAMKQKNFIGIPYQAAEKFTTFRQMQSILGLLKENGAVEVIAGIKNFTDSSLSNKPELSLKPLRTLGGNKDLETLINYANSNDVYIYPHVDFTSFKKSGNGISKTRGSAYSLEQSPAKVYPIGIATNFVDKSRKPTYLVKPKLYEKSAQKLKNNILKSPFENLCITNVSSHLVSDFARNGSLREQSMQLIRNSLAVFAGEYGIMTTSPNDYLLGISDIVTDLPLSSSHHIIFDYDVPFIQILLKGYIDYSGEPINFHGMTVEYFLRHLESGANLKFAAIFEDSHVLDGTDYMYLSGATYSKWIGKASEWFRECERLMRATEKSRISGHWTDGKISRTEYSNGFKVYVNYSEADSIIDGIVVPARWYAVKSS